MFEEKGYGCGVLKDCSGCCCGGPSYGDGVTLWGESLGAGSVGAVSATAGQHESRAEQGQDQELGRSARTRREERERAEEEGPEHGIVFCGGTVCDGDGGIDRESERGVRGAGWNDGRV